MNRIGELEEIVLLAVARLGEDAHGGPINDTLGSVSRRLSVGALYVTLHRLEEKGLIIGRDVAPALTESGRKGRLRRYYRVTGAGKEELRASEEARTQLRTGAPNLAGDAA